MLKFSIALYGMFVKINIVIVDAIIYNHNMKNSMPFGMLKS